MTECKKTWKRILVGVLAFLLVYSLISSIGVIIVFSKIFQRTEAKTNSYYLQYADVSEAYPRDLLRFPSGENTLQGYLYGVDNRAGLVVISHGLGSCAEGYLPETLYFVDHGYQVFAYDNTGCANSEGENMVGICQSVLDLDAALTYIEASSRFDGLPILLYGHSWGGYAVSSIFHFDHNITASVSVAGFGYPMEVMMDWGEDMVGPLTYTAYPFIDVFQYIVFGADSKINAIDAINRTDTPILLIHGTEDTSVDYDSSATVSHRDELTNPNVQFLIMDDEKQNDHVHLTKAMDAICYVEQAERDHQRLLEAYDGEIPQTAEEEFFAALDKKRSSELNEAVMQKILDFYSSAVQNP